MRADSGRPSRFLPHLTELLSLLTDQLERLAVLVTELARLLCQTAKALRLFAQGFVQVKAGVDRLATNGGLDTLALSRDASALRLLTALFGTLATRLRVLAELLGLPPFLLCTRCRLSHAATFPISHPFTRSGLRRLRPQAGRMQA